MHPIRSRPKSTRLLSPREKDAFSLGNVVRALASSGCVDGFERELLQDAAMRGGTNFDPLAPVIPWSLLAERDMTVAGTSGSQNLVGADVGTPADILRPWSVVASAGCSVLSGLQASLSVPRTTASITGYWLSTEATSITESQPTIGAAALSPKHAGAFLQYSKLMSLQAAELESFLQRDLLRAIGTLLDVAVLNGSGASGQPLGLFNTSSVGTQSGTSLAWAGVTEMQRLCAVANGEPTGWIGTPATRKILQARERASGNGSFIWDNNQVASAPAWASTGAPTASLCTGDWSQALVALWGAGPEISIDPSSGFQSGIMGMRISLPCDVAILSPAAFCISATVT